MLLIRRELFVDRLTGIATFCRLLRPPAWIQLTPETQLTLVTHYFLTPVFSTAILPAAL